MMSETSEPESLSLSVFRYSLTHLFFELSQLAWQVGHQFHGGLQLLLQVSDLILLPVRIAADQGHGPHPWEPVQVVVLVNTNLNGYGEYTNT